MATLRNRLVPDTTGMAGWGLPEWQSPHGSIDAVVHTASHEVIEGMVRTGASFKGALASGIDFSRDVACIMGIPFDLVDMESAAATVRETAAARRPCAIATANVNWIVSAREDAAFRDSILTSQACLIDGMPILWLGKLLGLPVRGRVSGAGLFERLCQKGAGPKLRVFLFGGPDGTAELACERINQMDGGVECVGWDSPGFGAMESLSDDERLARINSAGADFLIVALGASRGQAWIQRNQHRLNAPVISHLGAVVNFAAGTLKRAPTWVQQIGMEWAWRIKEEPKLWRRYAADAKALASMLFTRALPLLAQRITEPFAGNRARPHCVASQAGHAVRLKLSGSWSRADAGQLRTPFHGAAAANTDVTVDLNEVSRLDATSMGKLLLLYGHQRAIERPLFVVGASKSLRRQFAWHGAEFLLEPQAS